MQSVVTGRASRRLGEMSSSQRSQMPKRAVLDALQRLLDLLEQELLPVAQPEHHGLGVLGGGLINLVREIVGVEARLLHEGLLGALEQAVLLSSSIFLYRLRSFWFTAFAPMGE